MTGQSSSITYGYAVQVDADTPATGTFTALRRRSGSFTSSVADIDDGEVSDGRLAGAPGSGRQTHSGTFEMNFREEILDDFMRSAFASDWVIGAGTALAGGGDVLSLGETPVYFTFVVETNYLADNTRHYTQYVGCTISSMGLAAPQDGFVTLNIEFGAANRTFPTAAPWATLVGTDDKERLRTCVALNQSDSLLLATKTADALAEVNSIVNTLDWNIANQTEELFDVRQCDPAEIALGQATISGNVNAYHDDESDEWARDAVEDETAKLQFTLRAETYSYTFDIPQMTNRTPGIDPSSETVAVNMPWGAVNQTPTITRTLN